MLENRLKELRNTNPDETIKIGNYILNHSTSKRQKSNTLAFMSFAYLDKKETKKAIALLFKSKDIAEETGDTEIVAKIYGTIAQLYLNIGFNDKAELYLHKAIVEIRKLPEGEDKFRLIGLSNLELGKLKSEDKDYQNANIYFQKSLSEFNKMDDNALYFIKRSYYNIGNAFYSLKSFDSAFVYIKKATAIKQNEAVNPYVRFTLSNLYIQDKQYKRAVDTLNTILEKDKLNDNKLKSDIYFSISKAYNELGDHQNFEVYNNKYLTLQKEIRDNNLGIIKNVVNSNEKKLTNQIYSVHNWNKTLLFIILIISCLTILIILQFCKKRKNQKKQYDKIIAQLKNREEEINFSKPTEVIKESNSHLISSDIEKEILEKLEKFEKSDKFTNSQMSVSSLSIQLKTNTTYLSKIINKYKKKNFNTYINELRINYICEKIHNDHQYLDYKISYLGELAGFTSHSAFATIFKSVTGISPSTFLKETEKNSKSKI